jgi:hypothetical protein
MRVEPEQMRQPDQPAFCRVHRNGRPLIGMTRCISGTRHRPYQLVRRRGVRVHDEVGVQGHADPLQEGNGGHDTARF